MLQIMDSTDALKQLAGLLPAIVGYLAYSKAGVFNEATRSITAQPVGWTISIWPPAPPRRSSGAISAATPGYGERRRSRPSIPR